MTTPTDIVDSASQPLQHALGCPWTLRSEVSTKAAAVSLPPVPLRVSMSKNAPKLVPPPPVPPLGSTSDRPWLIPGYEEDEQRRTKLKLTPLSRLIAEKKTSGSSSQMHEPSHAVHTSGHTISLLFYLLCFELMQHLIELVPLFRELVHCLVNWYACLGKDMFFG
ncbi:hypothetical protein FXO37_09311 [Capsicum annuum]|nr:hypothetical protein FXO37_09311 [Capsicum annuum]